MRALSRQTNHSNGRLLVVDDDLVQRTIIGKIGARLGYDTVIASTFEIASELLRNESFDIMTLDLSLGERDGIELLRLVADLKLNAMPIVIISGCDEWVLSSTKRVGNSLELSLTCCLTKPLDLDKVRNALLLPGRDQAVSARDAAMPTIDRERILTALNANEFFVEFQPKVDLRTGRAVGAEALARWRMPEFGMISPAIFIPMVERFGLMPELTDCIVAAAIADSRKLSDQHPGFTVAVNLSGSLLTDLTLPERIGGMLRERGVAPESLIVEVTENLAISDAEQTRDLLVRLRINGVGAAMVDFGTGSSSLVALSRLPFSELKIDQSLVKDCDRDGDKMRIVDASIALGRAFGMKVVADGIDNDQSMARLRLAGCDVGQGYLFSPAFRRERVEKWVIDRNAPDATPLAEIWA
jgi:EAL domain-containing protein (putative c-di-GMP-specific phosphodiesterase class I)